MPYIPISRQENPHRFLPYPEGHAVSSPICVRCGLTREQGHHGERSSAAKGRFTRALRRKTWKIFG